MKKRTPLITDLAPTSAIEQLRFIPALSAGSRHLMTADELAETIAFVEQKVSQGLPNAEMSLALLRAEQSKRATDTLDDRASRLRNRIAWEVAQEKKMKNPWAQNLVTRGATSRRYVST
ncbi:hypothetical protein [Marivita sp.]|uniref:hypothetical protein n=1 Tax=Marivita sp. TaxID=2003365 RepID=UPI0025BFE5DC|nr:hypothetical protein [Marivita sp.]